MKGRASCNTLLFCFTFNINLYGRQRLESLIKTQRFLPAVGFRVSGNELKIGVVKPQDSL